MADTTFVSGTTITSAWLNDMNSFAYDTAVYLPRYGAVGDGVTDDSAAIQNVINTFPGRVIDGLGKTYKCDSVLTGISSYQEFQNMTLDFSGISTVSAKYMYAHGTTGSASTLTSNLTIDDVTVDVADTSAFSADQWCFLASDAVWGNIDGTTYGQYVKIKSVDTGTQLTLYAGPVMAFNTADSATITPVTMVVGVKMRNLTMIGSGANSQRGMYIFYGQDCVIDNTCTFTDIDYTAVVLDRSVNCKAAPTVRHAAAVGTAYGVGMYNGCIGCATDGGYGEDVRHYVTVGDTGGVNINCRATTNVVMYARSAGIDSHVASYNFIAERNQIFLASGYGSEGVTLQGVNCQAIGNIVRGVTGVGIFVQPLVNASGFSTKSIVRGNHIYLASNVSGTPIGVYLQNDETNGCDFAAADVDGNFIYGGAGSTGSIHVYVLANKASSNVKNINIRGNVSVDVALTYACYIRALGASSTIDDVIISSNHFKTSGTRVVYVLADGTSSTISKTIMQANSLTGGSTAVVGIEGNPGTVSNFTEDATMYTSGGGNLFAYTGNVTNLNLRTARRSTPSTITSGTGATVPYTDTYIFNNAGTVTFTLASAATFVGREIMVRTITANAVDSASSNVVPLTSATAGTSILPATDGAWAILKSDGTSWQIIAGSAV